MNELVQRYRDMAALSNLRLCHKESRLRLEHWNLNGTKFSISNFQTYFPIRVNWQTIDDCLNGRPAPEMSINR